MKIRATYIQLTPLERIPLLETNVPLFAQASMARTLRHNIQWEYYILFWSLPAYAQTTIGSTMQPYLVRRCTHSVDDKVQLWSVFNEPNLWCQRPDSSCSIAYAPWGSGVNAAYEQYADWIYLSAMLCFKLRLEWNDLRDGMACQNITICKCP